MHEVAKGSFNVTLDRERPYDSAEGVSLARIAIKKQFRGDLVGTSNGHMLSATGVIPGSAGYVAIERVTCKLKGKSGSFVLQHSGRITHGQGELAFSVVPDTGTRELTGLTGEMTVEIVGGRHVYTFAYSFRPTELQ
ncbi:MAG: DUF3224 domain-containing protein [Myxococcota bacterium]